VRRSIGRTVGTNDTTIAFRRAGVGPPRLRGAEVDHSRFNVFGAAGDVSISPLQSQGRRSKKSQVPHSASKAQGTARKSQQ
jgi:hypothetical protein